MHDGSIGKVTARIPWPNPLTSTIGLSVESPHLTFYLAPQASDINASHIDLAESVVSVAESFIHEELNPADEAALRESMHSGGRSPFRDGDDMLPGGLDPFMSDEELSQSEMEPPGVSIFATLLEKLLARFAFDADDVKVTIVNPHQASFTLSIAQVCYGTETNASVDAGSSNREAQGTTRAVTVNGVTVTTRCLCPTSPARTPTQQHSAPLTRAPSVATIASPPSPPTPPSPQSDSSDMDEDTQLMMSQSIAVLPPRPVSPATSVASSMYQSAVSTSPVISSLPPDDVVLCPEPSPRPASPRRPPPVASIQEVEDETVVSFGADPISIRLYTPAPASTPSPATGGSTSSRPSEGSKSSRRRGSNARVVEDKLRVNVDVGVVALALNARYVRNILDIADIWALHSPPPARPASSDSTATGQPAIPALDVQFRLRGAVLLLLSPSSTPPQTDTRGLSDFFARPLVPPKIPHGYVRAHLEELSISASVSPAPAERGDSARVQDRRRTSKSHSESNVNLSVNLTLTELSVFAFLLQPNHDAPGTPAELYAYSIVITDPNLRSQYPRDHSNTPSPDVHNTLMPTFEVVDWTDPSRRSASAKLSIWRSKAAQQHQQSRTDSPGPRSPPRAQRGVPSSASPPTPRAMPRFLSTSPGQVGIGRPSLASGGVPLRPPGPAIVARIRSHSVHKEESPEIEVSFEPLHVYVDLGLVLGRQAGREESATMAFLKEVTTPSRSVFDQSRASLLRSREAESDIEDDADTPPATPRAGMDFGVRSAQEQEEERRRLEQLVLDDLDLGYDYRQRPKREDPAVERVKDWRKVCACDFPPEDITNSSSAEDTQESWAGAYNLGQVPCHSSADP